MLRQPLTIGGLTKEDWLRLIPEHRQRGAFSPQGDELEPQHVKETQPENGHLLPEK